MKLTSYIDRVFKIIIKIPKGKVITYKVLAEESGIKNPRNIGWILQQNTEPERIPCYKVVLSSGKLAEGYKFGGASEQRKKLIADGVVFDKNNKVKI